MDLVRFKYTSTWRQAGQWFYVRVGPLFAFSDASEPGSMASNPIGRMLSVRLSPFSLLFPWRIGFPAAAPTVYSNDWSRRMQAGEQVHVITWSVVSSWKLIQFACQVFSAQVCVALQHLHRLVPANGGHLLIRQAALY